MNKKTIRALEAMTLEERDNIISSLQQIVDEIERYRNSYFWQPDCTASGRRRRAFEHKIELAIGNDIIKFTSQYSESCRHCYYTKELLYNDVKTNTTRLKNIIQKAIDIRSSPHQDFA